MHYVDVVVRNCCLPALRIPWNERFLPLAWVRHLLLHGYGRSRAQNASQEMEKRFSEWRTWSMEFAVSAVHASGYVAKCACDVTPPSGRGFQELLWSVWGMPQGQPSIPRERKSEHSSALLPAALSALLLLLFATAARLFPLDTSTNFSLWQRNRGREVDAAAQRMRWINPTTHISHHLAAAQVHKCPWTKSAAKGDGEKDLRREQICSFSIFNLCLTSYPTFNLYFDFWCTGLSKINLKKFQLSK